MIRKFIYFISTLFLFSCHRESDLKLSTNEIQNIGSSFLETARSGEEVEDVLKNLSAINMQVLIDSLPNDLHKKAFWLNIYNGAVVSLLSQNPDLYNDRDKFFEEGRITVSGQLFSLNQIEHQILRKQPTEEKVFDKLRVDTLDYRIHFALNCGAKSCPPISFYQVVNLDSQLDLATRNYLKSEVNYNPLINTVELPKLMEWFKDDFGGKIGIEQLLKKQSLIPSYSKPIQVFKEYDWTLELNVDNNV